MKIGTSTLTGVIYLGKTRVNKNGMEIWTSKKDVTEEAVKAVFEHMYINAEETGAYSISIEGFGEMTLVRK